ncbi:MAG: acyl CoA:acetate/3-ketoacid CoA transferase, partial [Paracoccus sp. (in: a-proteobacteria)]|nr:acyl CoA:acetate/3-ketoacid CoA transferase [Paracoccus sp. (in: a-proteobacteria)]
QMAFRPLIGDLAEMDSRIFTDAPMGLREELLAIPLARRIWWDAGKEILFINLSRMSVETRAEIEEVRKRINEIVQPLGRRVDVVVNYDHFHISSRIERDWAALVDDLEARLYAQVSRYSSSAFVRRRLGRTLERRRRATIHDSAMAAQEALHPPSGPEPASERRDGG